MVTQRRVPFRVVTDADTPDLDLAETKRRAIELYREGELTSDQIAKKIGVSRATIYNWLNAAGVAGRRGRTEALSAAADVSAIAAELQEMRIAIQQSGVLELGDLVRDVAELRRSHGELLNLVALLQGAVERMVGTVDLLARLSTARTDT